MQKLIEENTFRYSIVVHASTTSLIISSVVAIWAQAILVRGLLWWDFHFSEVLALEEVE